jgi:hypothetical protein
MFNLKNLESIKPVKRNTILSANKFDVIIKNLRHEAAHKNLSNQF